MATTADRQLAVVQQGGLLKFRGRPYEVPLGCPPERRHWRDPLYVTPEYSKAATNLCRGVVTYYSHEAKTTVPIADTNTAWISASWTAGAQRRLPTSARPLSLTSLESRRPCRATAHMLARRCEYMLRGILAALRWRTTADCRSRPLPSSRRTSTIGMSTIRGLCASGATVSSPGLSTRRPSHRT